ncbi:DUF4344 domain-containing metallopeptidase [Streptomyces sp. G-G2]|uniref:DUF4344 domain-containing metallopeptidase n=1 Tax=Streptomyces sp. G-G2 TaxID=3046201 RepID=UPI0024BB570B|nr:DUF4344 domain-containing metallopeptidase [Streptomyces sp. G-G2]
MSTAAATAGLLCALTAQTACTASPPAPPARTGFTVRYAPPAAPDRAEAARLRAAGAAEAAAARLNEFLDLPHEVSVVARSCAGEGSGYDPGTRRVELCYDDAVDDRALFERAGERPADEAVTAVWTETVFHEAGHALVDALDLPTDGRDEEDAADRFAAVMLLRQGEPGERALRLAAREYELAAASATGPHGDDQDEHAPDAVRAATHLCHLYGAAPAHHPDLAPRFPDCAATWTATRTGWLADLAPLLRG